VSESRNDFERWALLVDRQACDDELSVDELEFCRLFELDHPACGQELATYAELANLRPVPDAASRALVDRALAQLEKELEAERAVAERAVSDEVRLLRPSRLPRWLALAGALALGVGATYTLSNAGSRVADVQGTPSLPAAVPPSLPLARAELVYASGTVSVSGPGGSAAQRLLSEGSVVETSDGAACVLIDSDINVCLAANSRMRLTTIMSPARLIELEAGQLATRLATQPEGMSLSILAGGVTSTAVGTAFSVEHAPLTALTGTDASGQQVITTVLNGKVRVGHGNDTAIVNAHERAVTRASRPIVSSVSRTEESPSWALLGPIVLWHDPVSATLDVRGEPAGAEAWLDGQWIGVAPLSSLIPVGRHKLLVRKDNQELVSRELQVHAGESREVHYDPIAHASSAREGRESDDKAAGKRNANAGHNRANLAAHGGARREHAELQAEQPEAAPSSAPDLLRQARQAVRGARFAEAAGTYQKLIANYSGSDDAQTALVLLGQLRLTQLADAKGALAPLNAYLQGGGALEVEARVARIEALHELGRSAEEASAIEDFLRHHPRSFEAKGLRARLVSLRGAP
jgi:PEGA domain